MDRSPLFKCIYCAFVCSLFADIVDHCIVRHPEEELKFKKRISTRQGSLQQSWQSKNFHIMPADERRRGFFIYSDNEKETIKVAALNYETPSKSPATKRPRLVTSTPIKKSLFEAAGDDPTLEYEHLCEPLPLEDEESDRSLASSLANLSVDDDQSAALEECTVLLPKVLEHLRSEGQTETFVKFQRLVAENRFPLRNIAFLLFLDTVDWFSLETTSQMRYSDDVKRFWRTGLKLFKGKFLRFMSGMKNSGQADEETVQKGMYSPADSKINFAVPDRKVLDKMKCEVASSAPGVLSEMIDAVYRQDDDSMETFKLCVDGKKLNAGLGGQKLGDVNLWGFEDPPTLRDREIRLQEELCASSNILEKVELLEMKGITSPVETLDHTKMDLTLDIKHLLRILSMRIHDLRKSRVGKKLTLEKLMKQMSGDWRSSRFAFAISALRTKVYGIDACVSDALQTANDLGQAAAVLNESANSYKTTDQIDLPHQVNYVCLQGIEAKDTLDLGASNETLKMVKQRSDAWFSIRETAVLTGSTMYKALGFAGLKKQQQHYSAVYENAPKEQPDAETLKLFEHGSVNEINAVATLTSKVLPVYFPDCFFVEEGCYRLQRSDTGTFIVSPDGSLCRTSTEMGDEYERTMGVEIKCPYPGKVFTTPVHYELPVYYVPQVLSEMVSLNVSSLLFISYSCESTVVFLVQFDSSLWERLCEVASELYPHRDASYPKRLHPSLKQLRKDMHKYSKDCILMICEVPSAKAKECIHTRNTELLPRHQSHFSVPASRGSYGSTVANLQCKIHKATECVQSAWHLCRVRATEVLVFLVANLDRVHKPDTQHTVPVAYAFKAYSMRTEIMRSLIEKVLQECYVRGLYTPVLSFDGQWFNIAVRDRDGKPLTLLQLQKDTFTEAKKEAKSAIIRRMFAANVLHSSDLCEVASQAEVDYCADENGRITSRITIGKLLQGEVFVPSENVASFIKAEKTKSQQQKQGKRAIEIVEVEENQENPSPDYILNSLPDEIVGVLDRKTIDEIRHLESTIYESVSDHRQSSDDFTGLPSLFEDTQTLVSAEAGVHQLEIQTPGNMEANGLMESDELSQTLNDDDFSGMLEKLKTSTDSEGWKSCSLGLFKSYFWFQRCHERQI